MTSCTSWSSDWLLMTPSCRSTSGSRSGSVTSRLRRPAPTAPFAFPDPAEMTSSDGADAGCRAWNESKQSWRMKASGLAWQPLPQLSDACWLWSSASVQQFNNNNPLDDLALLSLDALHCIIVYNTNAPMPPITTRPIPRQYFWLVLIQLKSSC